jgi:leucyl-tRNA synthetase
MDTFMCSSWYQYRYLSPWDNAHAFDPEEAAYWLPVDQYTGGIEHATMHLMYTRFFTKAMRDCGIFEETIAVMKAHGATEADIARLFTEPMLSLRNQGTILGEPEDGHLVVVDGEFDQHALVAHHVAVIADYMEANSIAPQAKNRVVGEVIKRIDDTLTIETQDKHNIVVQISDGTSFDIPGSGPGAGLHQIKYRLGIEKMSKSKGNVVSPDALVKQYGADSVRAYMMFAFRWEKGGPWDSQGMLGVVRWINDVWTLVMAGPPDTAGADTAEADHAARRKLHQTIQKLEEGIQDFSFNTAVASLMALRNHLQDSAPISAEVWHEVISNMLLLIAPIAPFLAEELWEVIGNPYSIHNQPFPVYDAELIAEDVVTLVVQINGKVRDRIQVPADISAATAEAKVLSSPTVQRFLEGKTPKKIIYIEQRHMVNIVL